MYIYNVFVYVYVIVYVYIYLFILYIYILIIKKKNRCFHFSEIPHIEDFGGLPLIKPLNSLSSNKKVLKSDSSNNKATKKITMPSVGGENLNSGLGIFIFQGKAAWYKKHGSNCICGGRWRKW